MIEKKTIIDQIEITRDGTLQIRMSLQIVEDGEVIDERWHRTSIPPGVEVDGQMQAVNSHLSSMGRAALPQEEIDRVKAISAVAQTEEVISAYQAKNEAPAN